MAEERGVGPLDAVHVAAAQEPATAAPRIWVSWRISGASSDAARASAAAGERGHGLVGEEGRSLRPEVRTAVCGGQHPCTQTRELGGGVCHEVALLREVMVMASARPMPASGPGQGVRGGEGGAVFLAVRDGRGLGEDLDVVRVADAADWGRAGNRPMRYSRRASRRRDRCAQLQTMRQAWGLGSILVNAAELDRRARTYDGWIPPHLVSYLIDHGHLGEVEHEARAGDWFCAQAWVRILIGQERRENALEVLTPYLATGWWRGGDGWTRRSRSSARTGRPAAWGR